MRGTRIGRRTPTPREGIIPAHAGNTCLWFFPHWLFWDHPRACGEHTRVYAVLKGMEGSSPRMRGTRDDKRDTDIVQRIIPAHAGNTGDRAYVESQLRDHPRACGEHLCDGERASGRVGSSPRMRGTRCCRTPMPDWPGIIPAHAGNTVYYGSGFFHSGDHPRACGEHLEHEIFAILLQGSSPRMRGTPLRSAR